MPPPSPLAELLLMVELLIVIVTLAL